jgi:hypothetical protein
MALWDKVKQELDRAGRAAQDAIDDGKVRLDAFRARQLADKAAQALGYAVYRAREAGDELDSATFDRLSATLATHESEASRLEAQFESGRHGDATGADDATTPPSATADATETAAPPGSTPPAWQSPPGASSTPPASPPGTPPYTPPGSAL